MCTGKIPERSVHFHIMQMHWPLNTTIDPLINWVCYEELVLTVYSYLRHQKLLGTNIYLPCAHHICRLLSLSSGCTFCHSKYVCYREEYLHKSTCWSLPIATTTTLPQAHNQRQISQLIKDQNREQHRTPHIQSTVAVSLHTAGVFKSLNIVAKNANTAEEPSSMLLVDLLVVPHRHCNGIPVTQVSANHAPRHWQAWLSCQSIDISSHDVS